MTMTLDELSSHEEIRQAIYRHFRAVDRLDLDLDRTAFWDDGVFEGGPFQGSAAENMPALFDDKLKTFFNSSLHYMMNMLVELRGDAADVEIYGAPYHVVPPESLEACFGAEAVARLDRSLPHELHMGTRYVVRMERREGTWRIAVMKLIIDWNRVVAYTGFQGGVMEQLELRGARDRSDASYASIGNGPADGL